MLRNACAAEMELYNLVVTVHSQVQTMISCELRSKGGLRGSMRGNRRESKWILTRSHKLSLATS